MSLSEQAIDLLHRQPGRKRISSRRAEAERDHRPVEPANEVRLIPRISLKPPEKPAAASNTSGPLLVTEVERRLLRACRTVRAVPDASAKYQVPHNCWPEMLQSIEDAYGYTEIKAPKFKPSPRDVSDMLTALAWARVVDKKDFRLIWWRSFGISFKQISLRVHRSDETARRWYCDALLRIWHEANYAGQAVAARGRGQALFRNTGRTTLAR